MALEAINVVNVLKQEFKNYRTFSIIASLDLLESRIRIVRILELRVLDKNELQNNSKLTYLYFYINVYIYVFILIHPE